MHVCQVLPLDGQQQIVAELASSDAIGKWCYDSNGNHVIQKCIESIKPTDHIPRITQVNLLTAHRKLRSIIEKLSDISVFTTLSQPY